VLHKFILQDKDESCSWDQKVWIKLGIFIDCYVVRRKYDRLNVKLKATMLQCCVDLLQGHC